MPASTVVFTMEVDKCLPVCYTIGRRLYTLEVNYENQSL